MNAFTTKAWGLSLIDLTNNTYNKIYSATEIEKMELAWNRIVVEWLDDHKTAKTLIYRFVDHFPIRLSFLQAQKLFVLSDIVHELDIFCDNQQEFIRELKSLCKLSLQKLKENYNYFEDFYDNC